MFKHVPRALPPSVVLLLLALFCMRSPDVVAQPGIDITERAVQTFYAERTPPHTDRDGNLMEAYQPGVSFFPIGIYSLTPCLVTEHFSWSEPQVPPAGWDGTYTLLVNLGDELNTDDPDLLVFVDRHPTADLEDTAKGLPASTQLYYSVWTTGAFQTVSEGPFVSQACPPGDPDEPDGRNSVQVASDAGFNFSITGPAPPSSPSVLLDMKVRASGASGFDFVLSTVGADGSFREALFDQYKEDPDIFGWYLADEPYLHARNQGSAAVEAVYNDLLSRYESHKDLTSQVFFLTEWGRRTENDPWWSQFIRIGDAASHDNYLKDLTGTPNDIPALARSVAAQTLAVTQAKPSWIVLQAFGSPYASLVNAHRFPTPDEVRAYVYTSIVHGATGVIFFAWDSSLMRGAQLVGIRPDPPPGYPENGIGIPQAYSDRLAESAALWDSLDASKGGLNAELRALEPVLLSPTAQQYYQVFVDQDPHLVAPIRTMLKAYGEHSYLLAVNITEVETQARFVFQDEVRNPEVLFEGRTISPSPGEPYVLGDHFGPFAVHVYRFDKLTSPPAADSDGDGLPDFKDNCPEVYNPDQANTPLGPIDNGPQSAGNDSTNPSEDDVGDACDLDADNDGLPDADEDPLVGCGAFDGISAFHPSPTGGDLSNDDDHDGDPAPLMGSDTADNGPSWDTDGDGVLDGAECALGYNPRDRASRPNEAECKQLAVSRGANPDLADSDDDGLPDAWESCGWGTDPTLVDSDGDALGDCREAADINGDGLFDLYSDLLSRAKAALMAPASYGKTTDLDINKDGILDFGKDTLEAAKLILFSGECR